jgi:hypothetical protein
MRHPRWRRVRYPGRPARSPIPSSPPRGWRRRQALHPSCCPSRSPRPECRCRRLLRAPLHPNRPIRLRRWASSRSRGMSLPQTPSGYPIHRSGARHQCSMPGFQPPSYPDCRLRWGGQYFRLPSLHPGCLRRYLDCPCLSSNQGCRCRSLSRGCRCRQSSLAIQCRWSSPAIRSRWSVRDSRRRELSRECRYRAWVSPGRSCSVRRRPGESYSVGRHPGRVWRVPRAASSFRCRRRTDQGCLPTLLRSRPGQWGPSFRIRRRRGRRVSPESGPASRCSWWSRWAHCRLPTSRSSTRSGPPRQAAPTSARARAQLKRVSTAGVPVHDRNAPPRRRRSPAPPP